jgi:threonine/homoserine/homoserine lactone efflux protein
MIRANAPYIIAILLCVFGIWMVIDYFWIVCVIILIAGMVANTLDKYY